MEKLEWHDYPMAQNFGRYVHSFQQNTWNVTDGQTDWWTDDRLHLCIASHSGKVSIFSVQVYLMNNRNNWTQWQWHTPGRFHSMPAERLSPLSRNKDCSFRGNSGSSNGRPDDTACFFNTEYFWPLNGTAFEEHMGLKEHMADDGECSASNYDNKLQVNHNIH